GVVERAANRLGVSLGISDDHVDPAGVVGDDVEPANVVFDELLLEEQVLGRITGDAKLGKDGDARAEGFCAEGVVDDLANIMSNVADGGIDLGESNSHRPIVSNRNFQISNSKSQTNSKHEIQNTKRPAPVLNFLV